MSKLDGLFHIAAKRDDNETVCGRQVGRVTSFKKSTWGHPALAPTECKRERVYPKKGPPKMWCQRCSKMAHRAFPDPVVIEEPASNRGRRRRMAAEDVAEAQRMADAGVPLPEIGRHFGVSSDTIRNRGVKTRRSRGRQPMRHGGQPIDDAIIEEAKRLVESGMTREKASKAVGVSLHTLKRHGVPCREKTIKATPQMIQAVVFRVVHQKETHRTAALALGISHSSVFKCLKLAREGKIGAANNA